MRYLIPLGALAAVSLPATLSAQAADEAYIKEVTAAAPAHLAAGVAVARMEPNGTVTVLREGTNGFTCFIIPDGTNSAACGDQNTLTWFEAAFSNKPAPTNKEPGIAYMAKGGLHHETADGAIVLKPSAVTREVSEPPHWMILWPFSAAKTGLPSRPNAGGAYVMFDGTPFAHLMIYQDPNRMK